MRDYSGWAAIAIVIITLLIAAGVSLAIGWVFMWTWNQIIAGMFNGPEIKYWVAVATMFLIQVIFKINISAGD